MDDFLHNLRSGKLKQSDRGRRDYNEYKGPQRRAGSERRRTDYYAKVTNENFALIKETLDGLADQQRRIAEAIYAKQEIDTRIAAALETLVAMLGQKWGSVAPSPAGAVAAESAVSTALNADDPNQPGQDPVPQHTDKGHPKRESGNDRSDILGTIASMRGDGESWEKIARHFDARGIPTISGKGKWRGTAVKKFWDANNARAGS